MNLDSCATSVGPPAGAAVMSTGVLALGARQIAVPDLGALWWWIGAIGWIALCGVVAGKLRWTRPRLHDEAGTPSALTAVASTAVLGSGALAAGRRGLGAVALGVAVTSWLVLEPRVARRRPAHTTGPWFLTCVATQSVIGLTGALLAGQSRRPAGARSLALLLLIGFVLGLGQYVAVLRRFRVEQLTRGDGDQWVAAGALAISALSATELLRARAVVGTHGWMPASLRTAALLLWSIAALTGLVLAVGELRRPRWGRVAARWATVFPLGMTALAGIAVGSQTGHPDVGDAGRALFVVAATAWCAVAAATVRAVVLAATAADP